ncbi:MAG: SDR family NAD(P)-dependent oxidoreductase [Nannocystales bacterium]
MTNTKRIALVVGVGPGLGTATARRLHADGYRVAVASRDKDRLAGLAEELDGFAVAIDATDPASVEAGVATVEETLGPIHTVVWNVGGGVFGTLESVDTDGLDLALGTNTRGLFVLAKRLLPQMAERGDGALVVTGATASLRGKPLTTAFAAGKAAQRSLTQSLAREWGPKGVHVALVIVDGMVDLPTTRARMPERPTEAFLSPDGFAGAVSFLLGQPRSAWTFELDLRPHVEAW